MPATISPTPFTGLRQKVFFDRYALKDTNGKRVEQTPAEMWHRVSRAIAQVEKTADKKQEWEQKFYSVLEDFKFVPGGRILTGAGAGAELTFYNCYVIPSPADSRGGIFESVRTMVEIMSRGGGVGVNLSTVRPRGSYVRGVNGTASGAVSFGALYSFATGLIIQGGSRRGALMLMLNDDHPDVEEFITAKRTMGQITNANLSVCVSDRFMAAVNNDADWHLQWGGKVYKTIKARALWNLICESAHAAGEPGVVFMERYNKESNSWYFEEIISVNPCVTGDTRVATNKGLVAIKELYEEGLGGGAATGLHIDSRLGRKNPETAPAVKVMQTGVKDVYLLRTKEGYSIKLTADHRVRTERGWVEARYLRQTDRIYLLNRPSAFGTKGDAHWGRVLGWFVGDDHFNTAKRSAVLSFFGQEKQELAPVYAEAVNQIVAQQGGDLLSSSVRSVGVSVIADRDEARISLQRLARIFQNIGVMPQEKLVVPAPVWRGTKEMQQGFLQGLLTADGHVSGNTKKGVSVRLTSVSLQLLQEVQQLALNFGVVSKIYQNRHVAQERLMPDGHGGMNLYDCQAQHDLVISKDALLAFKKNIGFLTAEKNNKLANLLKSYQQKPYRQQFLATFSSLTHLGKEMVYDLVEPLTHSFSANGLVVHNCGEQGLPAWGVCNLGAINLAAFVRDGELQKQELAQAVRVAIRFLDNVVDVTPYFFEQNRLAQMRVRRTGLGTMGLADALIKMKLRYASPAAIQWCDEVYQLIRDEAYRSSVEIAKEKGSFPAFDRTKYLQGRFIQHLPLDVQENIRQYGIRNGLLLTQAPTGTTSILADVSSGIEPVYDFAFKRKDRLGEHLVYHPLYQQWKEAHPNTPIAEKPTYFVSAKDLAPLEHVQMQAVIQKYTDSSISKTVNAPHEHTLEEVATLYRRAYELGCKGITYYRDGSRDAAVLESIDKDTKNKPEVKKEVAAATAANSVPLTPAAPAPRQRPEVVPGVTYKIKTGYGTMFVTINHDEAGKPFEVFATIGKAGGFFAAKSEAICRLISLALRSNIPVDTVIDQLKGIRGPMPSWGKNGQILSIPDAIAQVLITHIREGQRQLYFKFSAPEGVTPLAAKDANSQISVHQKFLQESGMVDAAPLAPQPISVVGEAIAIKPSPSTKKTSNSIADAGVAPECPECGGLLALQEGCMTCHGCGFSKCA